MALKGDLRTVNLSTILQLLESENKTGLLHIKGKDKVVGLFLKDGNIAYATCSQADSRLGYLLKSSGVIPDEQLETYLSLAKEKNQALGKILVDKNIITEETLSEFVHKQAENIIYDLLFWKSGGYEFRDIEIDPERMLLEKIGIMNVLLEASRRIDVMEMMREQIPDNTLVLDKSGDIGSVGKELTEQEQYILALVDGKCSVKEIIEKSGLDEYSVFSILNALILSGCIHPGEDSRPQEPVEEEVEKHDSPTLEDLQLESEEDREETEETIHEEPDPSSDTEVDVPSEDVASEAEAPQESEKVVEECTFTA